MRRDHNQVGALIETNPVLGTILRKFKTHVLKGGGEEVIKLLVEASKQT